MPAASSRFMSVLKPKAVSVGDRAVRLADGLSSFVTGMGGDKDKLASAGFSFAPITPFECEAAYRTDWVSRKIIDIPPYDMTREWRSWQGDENTITKIEDLENRLNVAQKTQLALTKARLYGGGALILGVNQGKNDEELNVDALKADDLVFVHAVSRWDVGTGQMIRDIGSPYFSEPEYYERTNSIMNLATGLYGPPSNSDDAKRAAEQAAKGVRFHPSRVVRFLGAPRPDMITSGEVWGDPVLQVVLDACKACGLVVNSTAQLVAEAKVDVIKIPGLTENITNVDYEARLQKRWSVANMVKGVFSMLLVDKEEEWERHAVTFSGLNDILAMYFQVAAGAGDMPATRFLSQSPAGLNATGESDIRNHYDMIKAKQKNEVTPLLSRLDNVLIVSALGSAPPELFYEWNPLWQQTEKEKAETAKAKADTFKVDVDAAVLDDIVLKKARENQLIEDGTYPGFEQILNEFDGQGISSETPAPVPGVDPVTGLPIPIDPNAPPAAGGAPAVPGAPAKPGAKPSPFGKSAKKAPPTQDQRARRNNPQVFRDMQRSMRFTDSTPRTLYVYRELLNVKDIAAWAKSQGFDSILNDLHVTLIYSKERVDWVKVYSTPWQENEDGTLTVKQGGPRVMEQFGTAQVLVFGSSALSSRNSEFRYQGCSYDYEDYNPHITISYRGDPAGLSKVEPYQGVLEFGPEIWEELNPLGFDETDPKVERMLDTDGESRVVLKQGLDAADVEALVKTIIDRLPAPRVEVTDRIPDPATRYKEVTIVTKHDDQGRILEFVRRKVEDQGEQG